MFYSVLFIIFEDEIFKYSQAQSQIGDGKIVLE